ncbi:hypothetical protein [Enterococcus sp. LJL128]
MKNNNHSTQERMLKIISEKVSIIIRIFADWLWWVMAIIVVIFLTIEYLKWSVSIPDSKKESPKKKVELKKKK